MITENRLTAYINSLDQGDEELIEQIAETAVKNRVPIIRRETAALLKTMVTLVSPARILEVGTAVGYSALLMASVMPENCRITTIEKYEKHLWLLLFRSCQVHTGSNLLPEGIFRLFRPVLLQMYMPFLHR